MVVEDHVTVATNVFFIYFDLYKSKLELLLQFGRVSNSKTNPGEVTSDDRRVLDLDDNLFPI